MENIAEKKKAILESTLELIKENGFHGTPMSLVAKKAGVACGTIYHYFESKDMLIIELHAYIREKMLALIEKDDDENLSFKDRFHNYWINHYQFYIEHPDYLLFIEQYVNSPYYIKDSKRHGERMQKTIINFFMTGVQTGILKSIDHQLLSSLIHSNIIAIAKINLSGKMEIKRKEVDQVFEIIWDGIRNKKV